MTPFKSLGTGPLVWNIRTLAAVQEDMGHIAKLTPVGILALALMASLGGCDRSQGSPPSAAANYITMAMASPEGQSWGLSPFPKTAGTKKCQIRGGGLPPGILVPSVCTTSVIMRSNNEATVRFVQRWNAHRFHADSGRLRHLSHTWEITVSRRVAGDHVVWSRGYGDFPPQHVRRPPPTSNPNLAPPHANGGNIHPRLGV
jgi:hypothetical protein